MNLALLDPFARKAYPELLGSFVYEPGSFASLTKFNRRGTLLASGCHNGLIVIWDVLTGSKAKTLTGHSRSITSLSWSRDNKMVLSSSMDWKVILWDVISGAILKEVNLGEPVLNASIHPRNSDICLATCSIVGPVLVDLKEGVIGRKLALLKNAGSGSEKKKQKTSSSDKPISLGAIGFNRDGSILAWGDTTGHIHIIDAINLVELKTIFLGAQSIGIKQIVFNKKGTLFLTNSNDRKIRLYDLEAGKCLRTFVDPVKKNMWKCCEFSSNSDFVVAGSSDKAEHHIYIWDRQYGNLVYTIEGPKEGILDLQWHPLNPIIVSCAANSGVIYFWTTNYTEHWSAYAPNFTEMKQNDVYEEKEDEFDIMDSEEHVKRKKAEQLEQEEGDVDIMTIDPIPGLSSEEEGDLLTLPARPQTPPLTDKV